MLLLLMLMLEDAQRALTEERTTHGVTAEQIRLQLKLTEQEAAAIAGYTNPTSWSKAVSCGSFERFRLNRLQLFTGTHPKFELVYRSTGAPYLFHKEHLPVGPTSPPAPEKIAQARVKAGLTQGQACLLTGIKNTSTWSLLESGLRKYTNEQVAMDPVRFEWFALATDSHPDFTLNQKGIANDSISQPSNGHSVRSDGTGPSFRNLQLERDSSAVALLRQKQAIELVKQALDDDGWTVEQLLHYLDPESFSRPNETIEITEQTIARLALYRETMEDEALEPAMLLPRRAPRLIKANDRRRGAKKRTSADGRSHVSVLYKGPSGETWSGRGSMPLWMRTLIESGAVSSKEELLVKPDATNLGD